MRQVFLGVIGIALVCTTILIQSGNAVVVVRVAETFLCLIAAVVIIFVFGVGL
jgi:hypothetical protein